MRLDIYIMLLDAGNELHIYGLKIDMNQFVLSDLQLNLYNFIKLDSEGLKIATFEYYP